MAPDDLERRERRERVASVILLIVVIAVVANFLWLATDTPAGSALGGYEAAGHYYVSNHGSYAEVAGPSWAWRRVHEISVIVTMTVVLLGGILASGRVPGIIRIVALIFRRDPPEDGSSHGPD